MSFFKAYDMRGVFGRDFDLDTVWRVGRWLPEVLGNCRRVAVGRDARLSSPAIHAALCRGLTASGCDIDDLGLATTPMVYFATAEGRYDASVQITASHNPADCNGMKVSRAGALPVGYDTGLADLEKRVASGRLPREAQRPGIVRASTVRDAFLAWLRRLPVDLSGLRIAVDCSNGMAGLLARDLFGAKMAYLNETPDGRFPGHAPNPLDTENCAQVSAAVRAEGLDAGVIFDGDADRAMFVDETGAFIQPDYLIPTIAARYLAREPGATVIVDIRASRGVIETLRAAGARVVMGRVGHAFAKKLMRETGAICGGELAGHYYFRDFFCCDSGELAALVVLDALASARRCGRRFSEEIAPVRRYATTGEINFRVADRDAALEAAVSALVENGPPRETHAFDGIRMEFDDYWVNVRKSNTEPCLRVIIEASDAERLAERVNRTRLALAPFAREPEQGETHAGN